MVDKTPLRDQHLRATTNGDEALASPLVYLVLALVSGMDYMGLGIDWLQPNLCPPIPYSHAAVLPSQK